MTPDQLAFGFFYNLDRAMASLMGASYEETMSSQIGRRANGTLGHTCRWFWRGFAWVLQHTLGGVGDLTHCGHAIVLADHLTKARKETQ